MRRRYYRRRRGFRRGRRRPFRRYASRTSFYRRVSRIASRADFRRRELKWHDDYVTEATQDTLMATWNYAGGQNQISQGDGKANRDGNAIWSIGQKYAFNFWNNSTYNIQIRLLALQARLKWDFGLESGPTATPMFDSDGTGYTMASYSEAQRMINPINKRLYRVLLDRTFTLQSNSTADARRDKKVSGYVKTGCRMNFDSNYSTTKPDKPVYFVVICSRTDNDTSTGAQIELSWFIRHHFKEL